MRSPWKYRRIGIEAVVLGLILLKYISDRFEAKYQELVEEGDRFITVEIYS